MKLLPSWSVFKKLRIKVEREQHRSLSHGERDRVRGGTLFSLGAHPSPGPQAGRPLPAGEAGLRRDGGRPPIFSHAPSRAMLAAGAAACLLALAAYGLKLFEPLPLDAAASSSRLVLDRDGHLLRAFTTLDGRWRLDANPDEVSATYITMLLAFEDRRFWKHPGVDPLALARAVFQMIRYGRPVSGGSTLTMQAARLLRGSPTHSILAKFQQIADAVRLEAAFSKREILALYLKLAPYGGNLEGVRAASLAYFGKEPHRLSVAEAALLVAIPQSPEMRRLDRGDSGYNSLLEA